MKKHISYKVAGITERQVRLKWPNDRSVRDEMFHTRILNGIDECPNCKAEMSKYYHPCSHPKDKAGYQCRCCLNKVFPMAGTIWSHLKVPLTEWITFSHRFLRAKKGVATNQFFRDYGYPLSTCQRLTTALRQWILQANEVELLDGFIEVDEGYIVIKKGGSTVEFRKRGPGSNRVGKVFIMIERSTGKSLIFPVADTTQKTIIPIIEKHVKDKKTATICSDSSKIYTPLTDLGFTHITVNHSKKEYVKGAASTNNCEILIRHLKNFIYGEHIIVTERMFPLYLAEFQFKYNHRNCPGVMFEKLLRTLPPINSGTNNSTTTFN